MQQPIRRRGRPRGTKTLQQPPTIQALDRAIDVLEALASHEGMTLSELAAHLEQSIATMHRVLAALERRNYVESSGERQEWFVGAEAFRLGSAFLRRTNIVESTRSVMRDLMASSGETSNLGIERDGDVLFVSQVETHRVYSRVLPARNARPASRIGHWQGPFKRI